MARNGGGFLANLSDKELLAVQENQKSCSDVVLEIVRRWTAEQKILNRELREGSPIFYVDFENQTIIKGIIEKAAYENGVPDSVVIEWLDENGSAYSVDVVEWTVKSPLFYYLSERAAKVALMKGLDTMRSEAQEAKPFYVMERHSCDNDRPVHGPFRNHYTAMQYAKDLAESIKKNHSAVDVISDEDAGSVQICMGESTIEYLVIRV